VSATDANNDAPDDASRMILWLVWLAFIGLVFWLGPKPFTDRRRRTVGPDRTVPVQILFAEREGEILDVDCMVLEPFVINDRTLPAGFLFSLHLEEPEDRALAIAACDAISDWAAAESIVQLHLRTTDGVSQAKLADQRRSLMLDLEGAYG